MRILLNISLCAVVASASQAETVTLKHAVELALTHSAAVGVADADQQRADAAYREARSAYVPSFTVGSGLGKTWGFPLTLENSAPSIVNLNTQSTLFSPATHDFVRAARTEASAAALQNKDRRGEVVQETILNYMELARWQKQVDQLANEESESRKMEAAVDERIKEGVDSAIERNKARLATARIRMRLAGARGSADVLRSRLAQATGLPAQSIETAPDSIPPLPAAPQEDQQNSQQDEALAVQAAANSFAVKSADEHAAAQLFRAHGEHHALWPSVDFAGQYSLLARYNNYDEFFKTFQRNNGSVGVVLRFPFLNLTQRARAQGADAEAVKAKHEARIARDQVSSETLRLQRVVQQLAAAREVADLEYQVAQSALDATQIRMDSGNATFHDMEDARAQARERRNAFLDAGIQLERAQITLLRSTGELDHWLSNGQ